MVVGESRWRAFGVLCLAGLMSIIDGAVVYVALPSIKVDLRFSDVSLVWVVNIYLLAFGGFALLSGRLADLFGQRRLFLLGVALFTVASAACGLADTRALLVGSRAIQGLGGAIVASAPLSLTAKLFAEVTERSKAMSIYSFASLFGGALGVTLGGVLTGALNWHWVFLINLPVGTAIYFLGWAWLPADDERRPISQLDVTGAAVITLSSMTAVYGIINANKVGWGAVQTLVAIGCSLALLIFFLYVEARVANPLVPLGLFRRRNFVVGGAVMGLSAFAAGGWSLITALYLQYVLKCSPEQIGWTFLPSNLSGAAVSLGLSARLVTRFGIKCMLNTGLLLIVAGLALLARAPVDGSIAVDVLPAMLLDGVGTGLVSSPMLLAVFSDIKAEESGVASGIVNNIGLITVALGLAVLISAASVYSSHLVAEGLNVRSALTSGYHRALIIGALALVAGAFVTMLLKIEPRYGQDVVAPPDASALEDRKPHRQVI